MRLVVAVLHALAGCSTPDAGPADSGEIDPGEAPPRIILLIGDGMGPVHQELTSRMVHGAPGALVMEQLPVRGQILTASPSGITDSAASATAMATGQLTYNGRIAVDRDGVELETAVELARGAGLATGVVTTSTLTHATPAAFTAHELSRNDVAAIAADQVREVAPEVMLGGGRAHFDEGLIDELTAAGYAIAGSAAELEGIDTARTGRLFGAFSSGHLPYVRARGDEIPDLPAMATTALEILERDPDGFFLMIEGARIDHASHANRLADALAETAELDQTVAAVLGWAAGLDNVTIIVTADHETGGLDVVSHGELGELPEVRWRWGQHTNRRVHVHALGPATELFDGALVDHRAIYQVVRAAITGEPAALPDRAPLASGHTGELRESPASQEVVSDVAGRLDHLRIDADRYGLTVGLDGLYPFSGAALVVLIDVDFGSGTGPARLTALGAPQDDPVDELIANLAIDGSAIPGLGFDAAAVSIGGLESKLGAALGPRAGFRRIGPGGKPAAPSGQVVINYDDGVRELIAAPLSGAEIQIPWSRIGGSPSSAIAVTALLTDETGAVVSNQGLPAISRPGALESVVVILADADGDGLVDPELTISVARGN